MSNVLTFHTKRKFSKKGSKSWKYTHQHVQLKILENMEEMSDYVGVQYLANYPIGSVYSFTHRFKITTTVLIMVACIQ